MPLYGRGSHEEALSWGDANLLQEWIVEEQDKRADSARFLVGLSLTGAVFFVLLLAIPAVVIANLAAQGAAQAELNEIVSRSQQMTRDKAQLEALRAQADLFTKTRTGTVTTINTLVGVLNAKSENTVIRQIRVSSEGGVLKVTGQAEALSLVDANSFISSVDLKLPGSQTILVSAQQSQALGVNGASFDFITTAKPEEAQ